jgi:rubrerythrin
LPSLSQLALESAREGCVRELYGAAVATWQSAHAQDPQIREVFSRIARDEAEHAALSLDLAVWLDQHLSEAEKVEVEAERQRALVQLQAELLLAPDAETRSRAGLPSVAQATALSMALFGRGFTQVAAATRTT